MPELVGTDILYRKWEASPPGAAPKAVFVLVHGLGAHSARWGFLAEALSASGFASYGIELRGFGRSPDRPRGHVDSLRVWERDILALGELAACENPGRKLFLLGESIGSLLGFNLACRYPDAFAGQALISPDFKNGLKFPLSSYLTLAGLLFVRPRKTIGVPFDAAMCTRDTEYQAVMDRNPDELRVASLKCLMSILAEQMRSPRLAARLRVPSLFLISGTDFLVDERASRKLFGKLALDDKEMVEYPEMHHALSIDLGRDKVFRDIVAWAERRI